MVYVRSRKFCCCLPVRFGVFVMTLLGMFGGGLIAAAGWKQISGLKDHPLPTNQDKFALYIHTFLYTILVIVSLFGFIGTIIKKHGFVSLYSSMLSIHLGFSIGSGIFYLITLFRKQSQEDIDKCINGATDELTKQICGKGVAVMKVVITVVLVLTWLIQLYGCLIAANYVGQLEDEAQIKQITSISAPAPIQPVTTYNPYGNQTQAPNGGYAFQQPQAQGGSYA